MDKKEPMTKEGKISFLAGVVAGSLLIYIGLPVLRSLRAEPIPTACEIVTDADDNYRLAEEDAIAEMQAIGEEFGPKDGESYFYQVGGGPMPQELKDFLELAEKMAEDCSNDSYLWHYPTLEAVKSRSKMFNPDGTPRE